MKRTGLFRLTVLEAHPDLLICRCGPGVSGMVEARGKDEFLPHFIVSQITQGKGKSPSWVPVNNSTLSSIQQHHSGANPYHTGLGECSKSKPLSIKRQFQGPQL